MFCLSLSVSVGSGQISSSHQRSVITGLEEYFVTVSLEAIVLDPVTYRCVLGQLKRLKDYFSQPGPYGLMI